MLSEYIDVLQKKSAEKCLLEHHFYDCDRWCKCANLSLDFIRQHPERRWHYRNLSQNHHFDLKTIRENPDVEWDERCIVMNPNFTPKDLGKEYENIMDLIYFWENPNFQFEDIEFYKDKELFGKNPNFNMETYSKNKDSFKRIYIYGLNCENLSFGEILQLLGETTRMEDPKSFYISRAKNVNEKDILENANIKCDYKYLSRNPNISSSFIISRIHEKWDFQYLYMKKLFLEKMRICDIKDDTDFYHVNEGIEYSEKYIARKSIKKFCLVNIIKKAFSSSFWGDVTKLGIKRLIRSLKEDFSVWKK